MNLKLAPGEKYRLPRTSYLVPFGPVNEVDLIRIRALEKWREMSGAKYTHGELLMRLQGLFREAKRVTSQLSEMRPGSTYWRHGLTGEDKPCVIFVVFDGYISSVFQGNRNDWEVMP